MKFMFKSCHNLGNRALNVCYRDGMFGECSGMCLVNVRGVFGECLGCVW